MTSRPAAVLLGCALAALSADCEPSPPPPTGVVHLLPLLESLARAIDRPPQDEERTSLGSVSMEAWLQHGGDSDEIALRVPASGRLKVWIAAEGPGEKRVQVTVRRGNGRAKVVLEHPLQARGWELVGADLRRFAGRDVRMELRAVGSPDARFSWGAPVLAGPDPGRASVVLWVVDTLRQDFLESYGFPGRTSPEMARFAREGTLFSGGLSTSSWTRPAMVSVMTGRSALGHGVVTERLKIPESLPTMAERLRAAGWYTVAIVTNPNAGRAAGLDRGFDVVIETLALFEHFHRTAPAEARAAWPSSTSPSGTSEWAYAYLRDLAPDLPEAPLFLYVHVNDPHAPNAAREPFASLPGVRMTSLTTPGMPRTSERYGATVRSADRYFGCTLRLLEEEGRLDDALVVLTADHGEEFLEHGDRGHGMNLHAETTRVPFVLRWPGHVPAGRIVPSRVSLVDLQPTILDLLGRAPADGEDGRSLRPELDGRAAREPGAAFYLHVIDQGTRLDRAAVADTSLVGELAILRGDWKLLLRDYGKRDVPTATLLYDTAADPAERTDLSSQRADVAPLLAASARAWRDREVRAASRPREGTIDPATAAQLRALGYVQ